MDAIKHRYRCDNVYCITVLSVVVVACIVGIHELHSELYCCVQLRSTSKCFLTYEAVDCCIEGFIIAQYASAVTKDGWLVSELGQRKGGISILKLRQRRV